MLPSRSSRLLLEGRLEASLPSLEPPPRGVSSGRARCLLLLRAWGGRSPLRLMNSRGHLILLFPDLPKAQLISKLERGDGAGETARFPSSCRGELRVPAVGSSRFGKPWRLRAPCALRSLTLGVLVHASSRGPTAEILQEAFKT